MEGAKTNFGKRIPQRVSQARNKSALLVTELRQEHVLVPVVTAIESGRLAAARQHLVQVAHGLVTSGATQADLLSALKATKAAKERSQLDWGRFSAQVIGSPPQTQAVMLLSGLDEHIERIRQHLRNAAAVTAPDKRPRGSRIHSGASSTTLACTWWIQLILQRARSVQPRALRPSASRRCVKRLRRQLRDSRQFQRRSLKCVHWFLPLPRRLAR